MQDDNPYQPPGSSVQDANVPLGSAATARLFRFLVVASTVCWAIATMLQWIDLPIADDTRAMHDMVQGYGALFFDPSGLIYFVFIAMWLIAAVGFFLFKGWGRSLFVWTYAITFLYHLFSGLVVHYAFEYELYILSTLFDGAALALAYTDPLKQRFERGG
ncbi:MAG TPA: hypothetical protein VJU83_01505 [Burkholderiales bacterium]|nr:hypothetical protein [Burkholderiales bacterium]